ncbi:MAG: NUDIX domain-containing protein [Candidatus Omnitrophota bacterium]
MNSTVVKKSLADSPPKSAVPKINTSNSPNKIPIAAASKTKSFLEQKKTAKSSTCKNTAANRKDSERKTAAIKKKKVKITPEFPVTKWGDNSVVSFEATEHLPAPELTSIAAGFVFHDDKLVLANIPGRGWEIIGGRIDIGETPEETFRREAMRQIGCELSHVKMIGVVRIEHMGPEPPNCPYPFPIGYGVQFIGIVDNLTSFDGGKNSLGRSLISPDGFQKHYYDWNEYYDAVFQYAYSVYQKWKKKLKL